MADPRVTAEQLFDRIRAMLDSLLDPHVYLEAIRDESGTIVDFTFADANDAACAYNHRPRADMIGATLLEVLPGHAASGILESYAHVVDSGEPIIVDGLAYYNEILGEDRRSEVRGIKIGDGLSLTWRDVTEKYAAATALAESEERYRLIAENSSDIITHMRDLVVLWASPSLTRLLGWPLDEVIGRNALELIHPDDHAVVIENKPAVDDDRSTRMRIRLMSRGGDYHWFDLNGGPFVRADGTQDGRVATLRIVDAEVAALQALELRARQDALTGLANRRELFDQVEQILERPTRAGQHVAVVFCDVDHFKSVNDSLGHAGGDDLLRVLSERIAATVRRGDVVSRFGGDELLVVLNDVADLPQARGIAEKLRGAVSEPVDLSGEVIRATMSIGVTLVSHGESIDDAVARADEAMYSAKRAGRDRVVAVD